MGRTAHRNLIDLSAREGRIVAAIKANVPRVDVKRAHGITDVTLDEILRRHGVEPRRRAKRAIARIEPYDREKHGDVE